MYQMYITCYNRHCYVQAFTQSIQEEKCPSYLLIGNHKKTSFLILGHRSIKGSIA